MIVLRVVLKDFRLLCVIEGPYELVNSKVFSPLFAVYEPGAFSQLTALIVSGQHIHLPCMVDIELSCA